MKGHVKSKNKINTIIYCTLTAIAIVLIILYVVFNCCLKCELLGTIFISIGASLLASVVLGGLIELSNDITRDQQIKLVRNAKLKTIKFYADSVFNRFVAQALRIKNIYNKNDKVQDEKITIQDAISICKEILPEVFDIDKYLFNKENDTIINLLKGVCYGFNDLGAQILSFLDALPQFEAYGYFSDKEEKLLKGIKDLIVDLNKPFEFTPIDYDTFYSNIEAIYENLIEFEEFKDLKENKYPIKK